MKQFESYINNSKMLHNFNPSAKESQYRIESWIYYRKIRTVFIVSQQTNRQISWWSCNQN